ncbi:exonuclease domain-containing protein, partial [Gemmatimonas sp.]|uniref:exonuclease domain-containing protein n=1 Tax=Gemmatimonas sp. TaxID=1962908 RepID=UPI00333F0931
MSPAKERIDRSLLAIDFETATPDQNGACSIGLVLVESGEIVSHEHYLIRPPADDFHPRCVAVHGITFDDVSDAGRFPELWNEVRYLLKNAEFVVARNAAFDRGVLRGTVDTYRLKHP